MNDTLHHQREGDTTNILCKGSDSVLDRYLEVKDALSKLHPLSGVRNSVVEATLCQAQHLRDRGTTLAHLKY